MNDSGEAMWAVCCFAISLVMICLCVIFDMCLCLWGIRKMDHLSNFSTSCIHLLFFVCVATTLLLGVVICIGLKVLASKLGFYSKYGRMTHYITFLGKALRVRMV